MSRKKLNNRRLVKKILRLVDLKQPEVKWACGTSIVLVCFFVVISLHSNFLQYENELSSLFQCVIAGLIGLIGVAIAGVAIVIVLFSREQIKIIEEISPGAFDLLLFDFKWLAIVSTIEAAIFIAMIFLINSSFPLAPKLLFYVVVFLLVYGVFYLLFYGCALIGNCIKLAKIKSTLDVVSLQSKSIPVAAMEFHIEFLVSRFLSGDKEAARRYYLELITLVENSSTRNKNEILEYLKERYSGFI